MNIVVIGSINTDLVINTDRIPKIGETIQGKRFSVNCGGKGANQAVAAAKLGGNVTFIGAVGNDENGRISTDNLIKNGINTDHIEKVSTNTGVAVITVCNGDNCIILDSGANSLVSREIIDKNKDVILSADAIIMQLEIPLETVTYTAQLSHNAGVKVILNPAPVTDLPCELLQNTDVLILNETEAEMLHNMFKFSDLMAKQVMKPRTDMICIPNDITYDVLNELALENQYTRYPVYEENIDKILGFIHVKDLYSLSLTRENYSIEKLIRPVMLVPETMTLDNLIIEFKKSHGQMAVVIDEFGGTAGLITLEDVLEEIIGEVQDEFDEEEEADIKEISENTYIANAMMRIDELVDFFDLDENLFEEDDVETIAGLVVKLLGRIAEVNDVVSFNGLTFTVVEIDGARITKLKIFKETIKENLNLTEELQ